LETYLPGMRIKRPRQRPVHCRLALTKREPDTAYSAGGDLLLLLAYRACGASAARGTLRTPRGGPTRQSPPTRQSRAVASRTPARRQPRSSGSRSNRRASSRRSPGRPRRNRPPRGSGAGAISRRVELQAADAGGRALVLDQPLAAREGRLRIPELVLDDDVHGEPPFVVGQDWHPATVWGAMRDRIAWIHQFRARGVVVRIDHAERGRARRRTRSRPSETRPRASRRCSVGGEPRCAR
jgi:hypothetical protein